MAAQDLTVMLPSRLDCPLSLEDSQYGKSRVESADPQARTPEARTGRLEKQNLGRAVG